MSRANEQCCARIWNNGIGGRCKLKASTSNSQSNQFCTKHINLGYHKLPACSESNLSNNGKHYILGRYDEWQDGEEGILPFKDHVGFLKIQWKTQQNAARVHKEYSEGALNILPGTRILYKNIAKLPEYKRQTTVPSHSNIDLIKTKMLKTIENYLNLTLDSHHHKIIEFTTENGTSVNIKIDTPIKHSSKNKSNIISKILLDNNGVARNGLGDPIGWKTPTGIHIEDNIKNRQHTSYEWPPDPENELCHNPDASIL